MGVVVIEATPTCPLSIPYVVGDAVIAKNTKVAFAGNRHMSNSMGNSLRSSSIAPSTALLHGVHKFRFFRHLSIQDSRLTPPSHGAMDNKFRARPRTEPGYPHSLLVGPCKPRPKSWGVPTSTLRPYRLRSPLTPLHLHHPWCEVSRWFEPTPCLASRPSKA